MDPRAGSLTNDEDPAVRCKTQDRTGLEDVRTPLAGAHICEELSETHTGRLTQRGMKTARP